jgi:hypothetical protein
MRAWASSIAVAILVSGCPSAPPGATACLSNRDCPDDTVCLIGRCSSMDAGTIADAGFADTSRADGGAPLDAPAVDAGPTDAGPCTRASDCPRDDAECCDGACVDLQVDPSHCGVCGLVCGPSTTCAGGRCQCADADHEDCNGDLDLNGGDGCEVDLRTDVENCGACRSSCTDQNVEIGTCVGRTCVIAACDALFDDCNATAVDGCETNLSLVGTCGSCATSCVPLNADPRCNVGAAGASCGYGACAGTFGDCDGSLVNGCETSLRASTSCGSCSTSCAAVITHATSPVCSAAGTCDYTACTSGYSDCDGLRGNGCERTWSVTTCGPACTSCGTAVLNASGRFCTATGTCDYGSCNASFADCDGNRANGCESSLNSATRCGSCTNDCTDQSVIGGTCGMGVCVIASCAPGHGNCDGSTANGCETVTTGTASNCCGVACTASPMLCDPLASGSFRCR